MNLVPYYAKRQKKSFGKNSTVSSNLIDLE